MSLCPIFLMQIFVHNFSKWNNLELLIHSSLPGIRGLFYQPPMLLCCLATLPAEINIEQCSAASGLEISTIRPQHLGGYYGHIFIWILCTSHFIIRILRILHLDIRISGWYIMDMTSYLLDTLNIRFNHQDC